MDLETRTLTREALPDIERLFTATFGESWDPAEREADANAMPWERTYGVFDGAEMVGLAADYPFQMTVPGGAMMPCAGVTWVGVLPTHRRRGILTGMMRRQLEDVRERGESLAALWASESVIYGRFGYGLGTQRLEYTLRGARTEMLPGAGSDVSIRLVGRAEAEPAMAAVYDAARATRPGMVDRNQAFWDMILLETAERRSGMTERFYAVATAGGRPQGYATYRLKWNADGHLAANQCKVLELVALSPAAEAALWRFLLALDLVTEWSVGQRPLDDSLPWMLADPRRLRREVVDGIWVRLVDVGAALAARRYGVSDELRLEVRDPFCPWNEGTHLLAVAGGAAATTRVDDPPDLRLGAAELGAAYLGGVSFLVLAAAGRVEELRPGALRRADAMFAAEPAPWCPTFF